MNQKGWVLVAAICCLLCVLAYQPLWAKDPATNLLFPTATTNSGPVYTNFFVPGILGSPRTASLLPRANYVLINPPLGIGLSNSNTNVLAPGLYKALPYSLLVMNPPPVAEVNVIDPQRSADRMPIISPELKLIPWK